jgi:hypothetical protein
VWAALDRWQNTVEQWPWIGILLAVIFLTNMFVLDGAWHQPMHPCQNHQQCAANTERQNGDATKPGLVKANRSPEQHDQDGPYGKVTDWLMALFTGLLALYTLQMRDSTRATVALMTESGIISEKQQDLAERQFIAAHRPRMVVRRLALRNFEIGKFPSVTLTLANTGGSEALIKRSNAICWRKRHKWRKRPNWRNQ